MFLIIFNNKYKKDILIILQKFNLIIKFMKILENWEIFIISKFIKL